MQDFISSLPTADEQYNTIILLKNLIALGDFVNDYAAAIALHAHVTDLNFQIFALGSFQELRASNRSGHCIKLWNHMAGRDAAMTVYHYAQALKIVRSNIGKSATLSASTDHSKLREAFQRLQKDFPDYDLARNSVGHRGETSDSLETAKRHGVKQGSHIEFLSGKMQNNAYVSTFKGKELRVELTETKRRQLSDITKTIYSAFPLIFEELPTTT